MSGTGPANATAPPAAPTPFDRAAYLNTDTSLDTIFFAVAAGAFTYAAARQGMEFSKLSSATLAAVAGASVYLRFWGMAIAQAGTLLGDAGTASRK